MKITTVTKREGELLGPIDYSYDFREHFKNWAISTAEKDRKVTDSVAMLVAMEAFPGQYQATTDGGWPRFGWGDVLAVGMYDGWPYWRPVPSVCIKGTLGGEWHSFHSITGWEKKGGFRMPHNFGVDNL